MLEVLFKGSLFTILPSFMVSFKTPQWAPVITSPSLIILKFLVAFWAAKRFIFIKNGTQNAAPIVLSEFLLDKFTDIVYSFVVVFCKYWETKNLSFLSITVLLSIDFNILGHWFALYSLMLWRAWHIEQLSV